MSETVEKEIKTLQLIIQSSPDGEKDWIELMAEDLPYWVVQGKNLDKLVKGNMVCFDPDKPYRWYRALNITKNAS